MGSIGRRSNRSFNSPPIASGSSTSDARPGRPSPPGCGALIRGRLAPLVIRAAQRDRTFDVGLRFATRGRSLTVMDQLLEMRARDVGGGGRRHFRSGPGRWWVAGGWGVDAPCWTPDASSTATLDVVVDHDPRDLDCRHRCARPVSVLHHLAERHTPRKRDGRAASGWATAQVTMSTSCLSTSTPRRSALTREHLPRSPPASSPACGSPCLSAAFQIQHHRMYRQRSTDRHDPARADLWRRGAMTAKGPAVIAARLITQASATGPSPAQPLPWCWCPCPYPPGVPPCTPGSAG